MISDDVKPGHMLKIQVGTVTGSAQCALLKPLPQRDSQDQRAINLCEPASSILRKSSLDIISRYFPDYPAEIRARLGGSNHKQAPGRDER